MSTMITLDRLEELTDADLALPSAHELPRAPFRRRDTLMASETSSEVTTLGWDTTYALRVADVNTVLRRSGSYPTDFEKVIDPNMNYGIKGKFGAWQIALGGSGGIVFLSMPIPEGEMTSGGTKYSMANSTAYISVKLKYIPQKPKRTPPSAETLAGANDALEIDDLKVHTVDRSEVDPAVVVQNLVFSSTPPPTYVRALMIGALQEWYNANLVRFAYIFSTVSLNEVAAHKEFQWLKPTYTGYGYFDGTTPETSYFGVLCMTDDDSAEGLTNQLAPKSIPDGTRAGFNIAMSKYMEKVILPGLSKGFPHATTSSFKLRANNTIIENTELIECDKVSVNGISYTPYIHNFTIQVVGDEIQLYTKTVINISPGIRSVVENTAYQTIVVVTKPDGKQTLDFKQTRPPRTSSYIDKDEWVTITELIVSIAGAVAGVVAGVVIKGAVKIIIACVIIAIVAGLAAATPELIAKVAGGGAASALPPIDLLVLNATAPINWPGAESNFTLSKALLNGAFQLGGDPHINTQSLQGA